MNLNKKIQAIAKKIGILGAYEFGSNVQRELCPACPPGDIDLLLVVENKTCREKELLDVELSSFGRVVHHPDFYSRRDDETIELIVLPNGSRYLASAHGGVLLGLSAFVLNPYRIIIGPSIDCLVGLPFNPTSFEERFLTFQKSEWGSRHLQRNLWPFLSCGRVMFDVFRLSRFFVMNHIWIVTGRMRRNWTLNEAVCVFDVFQPPIFEDIKELCHLVDTKKNSSEIADRIIALLYKIVLEENKTKKIIKNDIL